MLVSYLHLLRFSFCYLVLLCNIVVLSSVISCNFLHQTDIQIPKKEEDQKLLTANVIVILERWNATRNFY